MTTGHRCCQIARAFAMMAAIAITGATACDAAAPTDARPVATTQQVGFMTLAPSVGGAGSAHSTRRIVGAHGANEGKLAMQGTLRLRLAPNSISDQRVYPARMTFMLQMH